MKKIILLITTFILFLWSVAALEITITWNNTELYNDWFKFDTSSNSNINVYLIDNLSSTYDSWKRIDIIQNYNEWTNDLDTYFIMWTWVLDSELYWDFYIKDNYLELLNDTTINPNCENVSYSFTWVLISPAFWELQINSWSYYCPLTGSSSFVLSSELLWTIKFSGSSFQENYEITNSRWEVQNISSTDIFDDKKISINGLTNLSDTSWLESDYSKQENINLQVKIEWKMANFNRIVDKNISKYTQWLSPITNSYILDWFWKKINYYNFEEQEESSSSNIDNKWKILKIWKNWLSWSNASYYKVGITWQKLLYVKWWNIYIDADIYNTSTSWQLVIIVERDSTNRKNWWNVYINPKVTNIDATIIADWSILSYNWSNVLNTDTNANWLRKQLLIYGSISTKNTFWEDIATYWTDSYISNWWEEVSWTWIYNLAKLRSFQTSLNDDIEWDCEWSDEIIAKWNTSSWALKYAFAWKKECYITDDTQTGLRWTLRWTEKLTPLVIEYNPILQTNPHFILQNN